MQFTLFGQRKPPEIKTVPTPETISEIGAKDVAANPDGACTEDIIALIEYIDNATGDEWCDSVDALRIRSYCCQIAAAREHRLTGTIQQAQRHEECAELIYSNFPAHLRW